MTQVIAYAMTGDRDACVDGLKAFRNGREWTEEQRNRSIEAVNSRAQGLEPVALPPQDPEAEVTQDEGSSPAEFVQCEESAELQDDGVPLLRHGPVDNDNYTICQVINKGPALPQDIEDPSISFAMSFST